MIDDIIFVHQAASSPLVKRNRITPRKSTPRDARGSNECEDVWHWDDTKYNHHDETTTMNIVILLLVICTSAIVILGIALPHDVALTAARNAVHNIQDTVDQVKENLMNDANEWLAHFQGEDDTAELHHVTFFGSSSVAVCF